MSSVIGIVFLLYISPPNPKPDNLSRKKLTKIQSLLTQLIENTLFAYKQKLSCFVFCGHISMEHTK